MNSPPPSPIGLIAEIRSLPRPVFILVLGQFINRFGAFVYPFLALYLRDKSFDASHVAIVLAAISAGSFFGPMAGGYLADAIGRRNTIVLSLFSSSALLLLLYFCDNYLTLILVGALFGFANFTFGPPSSALLTDLVPVERRIVAFALFRLAINAGFAVGPAVAGILYTQSPFYIFLGDALTTAAFGCLALFFLPHGLRSIEGSVTSPKVVFRSWIESVKDAHQNIRFRRFMLAVLFMGISFSQVFFVLSLLATDRGIDPAHYGLVMGFNGLLIILIEIPLTQWLKRMEPRFVLAVGYALIGLGCASFAFAGSLLGFFFAMTLFTVGEVVALPVGMAYSSSLAPEKQRGRYFGFRGMTWALSNLIASSGVWFYGELGFAWWILAGCLSFVGTAVILRK